MKIIAVNSSYRGDRGATQFLIDKLFKGATDAGATTEVITLVNLKINRCLACDWCQSEKNRLLCIQDDKDDVKMIFQKLIEADIIVYATPVYVFGISGLLKLLFERLYSQGSVYDYRLTQSDLFFHDINHGICSKPFVSLICCDNLEHETPKNAREYFETISRFYDAPYVGALVRNAGAVSGYGKDPIRAKQFPKIPEVHAAYEQAGRELATQGSIRPATQRLANQEIIPVPLFGFLMRLPLRPFKQQIVNRAREIREATQNQSN